MTTQSLWAPWRLSYIVNHAHAADDECFLCSYRDAGPDSDPDNLVIDRGPGTLTLLNRFPYNNGHLLIAPKDHVADLVDLDSQLLLECVEQLQAWTRKLRETLSPDGFNIGLNLGRTAGAGLPGHLHWHIVPRWTGDTNFMPVLGETNLIPQSLESLYASLLEPPRTKTAAGGN